MITILNYGLGNISAFKNILHRSHIPFSVASTPNELKLASQIIFPGVGSFDQTMRLLHSNDFVNCLNDLVLDRQVPILGICVGMQVMTNSSSEGCLPGLGWINTNVVDFRTINSEIRLPHIGWNSVRFNSNNFLFEFSGLKEFYFLHSFGIRSLPVNHNPCFTDYHFDFVSAFSYKNIFGVQFHPEKSHFAGQSLLKNFCSDSFPFNS